MIPCIFTIVLTIKICKRRIPSTFRNYSQRIEQNYRDNSHFFHMACHNVDNLIFEKCLAVNK